LEEVRQNFAKYELLDEQVRFLVGWFKDTLPVAPKLSIGGYIIIDDYQPEVPTCVEAVQDYRAQHGVTEKIVQIDHSSAFWQRLR
jgi:hypothetical protein